MTKRMRVYLQKEASWADHYSVMGRLSIVIPLDITERVKHLHHPTLIVYGSEDTFTAHSSADLTRLLPNAIAAPLPGGHLPHISAPKEFAALVHGWLTTTEPGGLTSTIK